MDLYSSLFAHFWLNGYPSLGPCIQTTTSTHRRRDSARDVFIREMALLLDLSESQINHDSSFIRNGGDSLSAIKLASLCRGRGLNVTVAFLLTATSIDALLRHVRYEHVSQVRYGSNPNRNGVPRPLHQGRAPRICEATEMQQSLIYGSQSLAGRNIIRYYESYSPANIPLVKRAWQELIHSEPIFRARFRQHEDRYCMVEEDSAPFSWQEFTFSDRQSYLRRLEAMDFDGQSIGCSFQVVHLVECESQEAESTVLWDIHHALIDGYSSVLLLNKHRRILTGLPFITSPSFVSLIEKVAIFRKENDTAADAFWRTQEEKYSATKSELLLPCPQTSGNSSYATREVTLDIPWEIVITYAREVGVTVASLFYAAWALTLSKYVDSNEVCFATVLCGRSLPFAETRNIIGPLINTVPFCTALDPSATTQQFLSSTFSRSVQLDSFQWSASKSRLGKTFATTMNIHVEGPLLEPSPLNLLQEPYSRILSELPLSVDIQLDGKIQILYHHHKYHGHDIDSLGKLFTNAIQLLIKPDLTIRDCSDSLLPPEMMDRLYTNGNCSSVLTTAAAHDENLIDLFKLAARSHPDMVAVEKEGIQIIYSELDDLSSALAEELSNHIQVDEVVCVHADRSIDWIIAIYGILKAGGIYCPLDEGLPKDVRDQNFSQAGGRVFLTTRASSKSYRPQSCALCFSVEELLERHTLPSSVFSGILRRRLRVCSDPDAGAYLCFTSGSSGLPKGVLCTHRSLVAFQKDFAVRLMARPDWRVAQTMSPAFDGSIHEIFSALSYGATLVLKGEADPFAHLSAADTTILTPSIAKVLEPSDFPTLSAIYLVGEAVPQDVCDRWASRMTVYNMYGPTEATCGATIKQLQLGQPVTLGRPNPSTRIYVLDSKLQLVPPGAIGEVYLAGVQVSQGYIGRPEETAKRFLSDRLRPYDELMYRTGDRGYWDAQGELRFLGRHDRQIKLRGFRVDLDDLEVRIQSSVPGCCGVAICRKDDYLIAMIQPVTLDAARVKEIIADILPAHAVPRHIVPVSSFPRTNAGKLDYKTIAASPIAGDNHISSRTKSDIGVCVAKMWREVLGLPTDYSLNDESDFLELGGHSISQLQLSHRLSAQLGIHIPLRIIILSTCLHDLLLKIEGLKSSTKALSSSPSNTSISPIEKDWWNKHKFSGGSSAFNVTFAFTLGATVDLAKLTAAWNHVLERHRLLRSTYRESGHDSIERSYLTSSPAVERVHDVDLWKEIHRSFDLSQDSLMRVTITSNLLLLVASHIICDFTTLNILLRDVSYIYQGIPLKPPKQYIDHIQAIPPNLTPNLEFWSQYLSNLARPSYSISNLDQRRRSYSGSTHVKPISTETFRALTDFSISEKVTPHQIALAAVSLALQHNLDETDIVLGAPLLGRNSAEAQEVVGLFLEPLPIRIRYPSRTEATSHEPFIRNVQRASQTALCHAVPWIPLLSHLSVPQTLPDNPLFDVMVSYHESYGDTAIPGVDAKPLYTWTEGAKFKLMVEFLVASPDTLVMRLEYSDECFDKGSIRDVALLIEKALDCVVGGQAYEGTKSSLREVGRRVVRGNDQSGEGFFGVLLEEL